MHKYSKFSTLIIAFAFTRKLLIKKKNKKPSKVKFLQACKK